MIAVIQRVKRAMVKVDDKIVGSIGKGILVLVGIEYDDNVKDRDFVVNKILNLRIFPDSDGKMNLSVVDIKGEILSVSQFTLTSKIKKGRRPDFGRAMPSKKAKAFYQEFLSDLRKSNLKVEDGKFGAMMEVELINDGPVTFIIDSKIKKWN